MVSLEESESAKLQDWLLKISGLELSSAMEIAEKFGFSKNEVDLVSFIHEVFQILTIRPKLSATLADLIVLLFNHKNEANTFSKIPHILMNEFNQTPTSDTVRFKTHHIRFMRQMCLRGVIKMSQIANIILDYVEFPNHFVTLLLFFAPDIEPQQFSLLSETVQSFPIYDSSLMKLWGKINLLKENDWKLLREYIEFGCPRGTVEYAIRTDDLELLKSLKLPDDHLVSNLPFYQVSFDVSSCTLAQAAASFSSIKCLKYLIEIGSPLESPSGKNNALFSDYAIASGNPEIESLITGAIDPTTAVIYRRVDVLEKIKDVDVQELAYVCIDFASIACFIWCLNHNAKRVDEYGLMRSVKLGHLAFIKFFIDQGTPITYNDETGNLYHFAARGGHVVILKLLHDLKCEGFDEPNSKNETPFLTAVFNKFFNAVKYLAEIGANIKAINENQQSATHIAAAGGAVDILQWLKDNNALDINAKDIHGNTPLACATIERQIKSIEFLVENGADINIPNNFYVAPIFIAFEKKIFHIASFFANHDTADALTKRLLAQAADQKITGNELLLYVLKYTENVKPEETKYFFKMLTSIISIFDLRKPEAVNEMTSLIKRYIKHDGQEYEDCLKFLIGLTDIQIASKKGEEQAIKLVAEQVVGSIGETTLSSNEALVKLSISVLERFCKIVPSIMQKHLRSIGTKLAACDTVIQTFAFDKIIEMASQVDYDYSFESIPTLISKCEILADETLYAIATVLYATAEEPMEDTLLELQVIRGLSECFACEESVPSVEPLSDIIQERVVAMYKTNIENFTISTCEFALIMKSYKIPVTELFRFVYTQYNTDLDAEHLSSILQCWATIGDVQQSALKKVIQDDVKDAIDVTKELNEEARKAVPGIAEHAFDSACVTIAAFKDVCNEEILCELVDTYISIPYLLKDDPTVYLSDVFLDIKEKSGPAAYNFLKFAISKLQPLDVTMKVMPIILSSSADALRVCNDSSKKEFMMSLYDIIKKASEIKPKISSKEESEWAFSLFQGVAIGFETLAEMFFPSKMTISGRQFLQAVSSFNNSLLEYRGITLGVLVAVCDMMETLAKKATRAENVALNKASNIKILELCKTHPELKDAAKEVITLIRKS